MVAITVNEQTVSITASRTAVATAAATAIADAGGYYTGENVELALQEIGADFATNVTAIGLNTTHRGLTNNPHSVTPAQLGLVIGSNVQAHNTQLDNFAGSNITVSDDDLAGVGALSMDGILTGVNGVFIQAASTGGPAVLALTQADVSEPYITFNPGSDIDFTFLEGNVTGSPSIKWDESDNIISSSHSFVIGTNDTTPRLYFGSIDTAVTSYKISPLSSEDNVSLDIHTKGNSGLSFNYNSGTGTFRYYGGTSSAVFAVTNTGDTTIAGGFGIAGVAAQAQQAHINDPTDLATCISAITAMLADDEGFGFRATT